MVKPVNYMTKSTIQKETGYASDKVTGLTVFGLLAGNKASARRVNRRLFANNKRGYVRNKEVWQCDAGECHYTVTEVRQGLAKQAQEAKQSQQPEELTLLDTLFAFAFLGGIGYGLWWVWTVIKSFFS
jgi:hypothetical protein